MWIDSVDIGSDHVRFDAVSGYIRWGCAVRYRIYQREQLPRSLIISSGGHSHHGPNSAMRVLTAIFADAGYVTLDVTRIQVRFIEGRIEQQDQARIAADEAPVDALQRLNGPLVRPGARENRPALRDGIDLALLVNGRAERRAVVEVRAAI